MKHSGWIGVDFDGTLATDVGEHPIPAMVERVKRWLSLGIEVRIVTARVNTGDGEWSYADRVRAEAHLKEWCKTHIGKELPITCQKDFNMYQLWDDRAVQVVKDTGERVGNINRPSNKPLNGVVIDEEINYKRVL